MKSKSTLIWRFVAPVILALVAGLWLGSMWLGARDGGKKPASLTAIAPPASTEPSSPANISSTTTQPAVASDPDAPTTRPVEPTFSLINIGAGPLAMTPIQFPRAMLRLRTTDGKVFAMLYSDDPRGVLTGMVVNSYYFDMTLPDISDPAELSKAVWHFQSPSSDRQDSQNGINVTTPEDVQRLHPQGDPDAKREISLQPMDAYVSFSGTAPLVRVTIRGKFWMYATSPNDVPSPPPQLMDVQAWLLATVPSK